MHLISFKRNLLVVENYKGSTIKPPLIILQLITLSWIFKNNIRFTAANDFLDNLASKILFSLWHCTAAMSNVYSKFWAWLRKELADKIHGSLNTNMYNINMYLLLSLLLCLTKPFWTIWTPLFDLSSNLAIRDSSFRQQNISTLYAFEIKFGANWWIYTNLLDQTFLLLALVWQFISLHF